MRLAQNGTPQGPVFVLLSVHVYCVESACYFVVEESL